jgi:hypothetical protein
LKINYNLENLNIDVEGIEMGLRGIGNKMGWIHLTRNGDSGRSW